MVAAAPALGTTPRRGLLQTWREAWPRRKRAALAERAQVASDRSAKIKELRMLVEMAKADWHEEEKLARGTLRNFRNVRVKEQQGERARSTVQPTEEFVHQRSSIKRGVRESRH